MNKVIVTGNLCRDIELRYIPDGTAVGSFSIAVNEKYKDKETTSFFNVTVWGKQAENCAKYIGKGSKVLIEGNLKQDTWEKDGQKHQMVKINAQRVEFIGKPREQAQGEPATDQTANQESGVDQSIPF